MKRQYYPRSRSKPRNQTALSCPQTRRASISSGELLSPPLNLEALNDGLISILECPVCFETMQPPIFQCKEGHNVCHVCKEKLKTCPLCRQLLVGRNFTVEHISNKLLRHCANQAVGCKELVSLDSREQHERVCPFRKYECLAGEDVCFEKLEGVKYSSNGTLNPVNLSDKECELPPTKETSPSVWSLPNYTTNYEDYKEPNEGKNNSLKFFLLNPEDSSFKKVEKTNRILNKGPKPTSWIKNLTSYIRRKSVGCVWSGVSFEILEHMKSAHPDMAHIGRNIFDLDTAKHDISLIPALGEVFWLHMKRDPRRKMFFALVVYIGAETMAAKYLYKFTIYSRKNGNKVSYTFQTPSDTSNVNDLFNRGEAVAMGYKALRSFIDEQKKLPWKLKIKRA